MFFSGSLQFYFFRVELWREPSKSLGISIVGGRGMGSRLSNGEVMRGIFIKHVLEDSPAGKNGTLKPGDRIIEVSSSELSVQTCAIAHFPKGGAVLSFTLYRSDRVKCLPFEYFLILIGGLYACGGKITCLRFKLVFGDTDNQF